ncbi:SCO family protein [Streptomyces montanisoli]|uniref:SCO family protein n=1 Tax=Streptomyces montanisoli TaxID=2798581 RepID=A0A940MCI1_9ACTN|nr:SCO family protein [Streptomyces montanisoli]MBP0457475.1 SCO family protein [Streptomyces montanisoli]
MHKKQLTAAAALVAAAALTLTACGSGSSDTSAKPKAKSSSVADVSGAQKPGAATVLDPPFTKPDLVLTDTHGKKFDLRAETKNKPTLLYFGYTHCPDICPLTMSNLGIARKALTKAEQAKLQVVFITTDPERDTPAQLGKWLPAAGDPSFIGLTGDFKKIQAAARSIGIGISPPVKKKDGTIESSHGAQVVAFSPKTNGGYLLFGSTTTAEQYAKALPKIIKGEKP